MTAPKESIKEIMEQVMGASDYHPQSDALVAFPNGYNPGPVTCSTSDPVLLNPEVVEAGVEEFLKFTECYEYHSGSRILVPTNTNNASEFTSAAAVSSVRASAECSSPIMVLSQSPPVTSSPQEVLEEDCEEPTQETSNEILERCNLSNDPSDPSEVLPEITCKMQSTLNRFFQGSKESSREGSDDWIQGIDPLRKLPDDDACVIAYESTVSETEASNEVCEQPNEIVSDAQDLTELVREPLEPSSVVFDSPDGACESLVQRKTQSTLNRFFQVSKEPFREVIDHWVQSNDPLRKLPDDACVLASESTVSKTEASNEVCEQPNEIVSDAQDLTELVREPLEPSSVVFDSPDGACESLVQRKTQSTLNRFFQVSKEPFKEGSDNWVQSNDPLRKLPDDAYVLASESTVVSEVSETAASSEVCEPPDAIVADSQDLTELVREPLDQDTEISDSPDEACERLVQRKTQSTLNHFFKVSKEPSREVIDHWVQSNGPLRKLSDDACESGDISTESFEEACRPLDQTTEVSDSSDEASVPAIEYTFVPFSSENNYEPSDESTFDISSSYESIAVSDSPEKGCELSDEGTLISESSDMACEPFDESIAVFDSLEMACELSDEGTVISESSDMACEPSDESLVFDSLEKACDPLDEGIIVYNSVEMVSELPCSQEYSSQGYSSQEYSSEEFSSQEYSTEVLQFIESGAHPARPGATFEQRKQPITVYISAPVPAVTRFLVFGIISKLHDALSGAAPVTLVLFTSKGPNRSFQEIIDPKGFNTVVHTLKYIYKCVESGRDNTYRNFFYTDKQLFGYQGKADTFLKMVSTSLGATPQELGTVRSLDSIMYLREGKRSNGKKPANVGVDFIRRKHLTTIRERDGVRPIPVYDSMTFRDGGLNTMVVLYEKESGPFKAFVEMTRKKKNAPENWNIMLLTSKGYSSGILGQFLESLSQLSKQTDRVIEFHSYFDSDGYGHDVYRACKSKCPSLQYSGVSVYCHESKFSVLQKSAAKILMNTFNEQPPFVQFTEMQRLTLHFQTAEMNSWNGLEKYVYNKSFANCYESKSVHDVLGTKRARLFASPRENDEEICGKRVIETSTCKLALQEASIANTSDVVGSCYVHPYTVTISLDGHVCFWEVSGDRPNNLVERIFIHESGISRVDSFVSMTEDQEHVLLAFVCCNGSVVVLHYIDIKSGNTRVKPYVTHCVGIAFEKALKPDGRNYLHCSTLAGSTDMYILKFAQREPYFELKYSHSQANALDEYSARAKSGKRENPPIPYSVALSPNGIAKVICYVEGVMDFYGSGEVRQAAFPHKSVGKVKFTPDSSMLIAYGIHDDNGVISVNGVVAMKVQGQNYAHKGMITDTDIHPILKIMASCGSDGIKIWNMETFELMKTLQLSLHDTDITMPHILDKSGEEVSEAETLEMAKVKMQIASTVLFIPNTERLILLVGAADFVTRWYIDDNVPQCSRWSIT